MMLECVGGSNLLRWNSVAREHSISPSSVADVPSRRVGLVIFAAGFIFQLGALAYFYRNFDAAILRLMADDAFYYLKIAENISNGMGSVFSPGEAANGYHPLWMWLLVGLHSLLRPTPEVFVFVALAAAVVCNVIAGGLLQGYVQTLGFSPAQGLLAAALYLFLPWTLLITLTGLETALYLACLVGFLWVAQRLLDSAAAPNLRQATLLGIAAGLVMLARTDAIFFTAPAFAVLWLRRPRQALLPLLVAGTIATLLLSPWLLWNLLQFGTIAQSSSSAIAILHHFRHPDPLRWDYWQFALDNYTNVTYWLLVTPFVPHTQFEIRWPLWPFAAWGISAALVGIAVMRWRMGRPLRLPGLLLWPTLALVFYYCAIRLFVQFWHFCPLVLVALIYALNFVPRTRLRLVHIGLVVLFLIPVTGYTLRQGLLRPQEWVGRIAYFQTVWPDHAPDGQKVCITDSGIPGYFARRHEVVNLDGLVNRRALDYIRAGHFSEYTTLIGCDRVILDESRLEFYDRNLPD